MPFKARNRYGHLLMRNQERARGPRGNDRHRSAGHSDIVGRCLERDLDAVIRTPAEFVADLDAWQGKRPVMAADRYAAQKQPP